MRVIPEYTNPTKGIENCSDDNCPCSVHCATARAKGDRRACRVIRRESVMKETLLLIILSLSIIYYCFLKGK